MSLRAVKPTFSATRRDAMLPTLAYHSSRCTPRVMNAYFATIRVASVTMPRPRACGAAQKPIDATAHFCSGRLRSDIAAIGSSAGPLGDRPRQIDTSRPIPRSDALDPALSVCAGVRRRNGRPALKLAVLTGPIHRIDVVRSPRAQDESLVVQLERVHERLV